MKITFRSLLSFFSIAVATASAVFLISSLHAATAQAPNCSGLDREVASVDSAEQQAVLAPITQLFDGMAKRDAATIKKPLLSGGTMVLMRDETRESLRGASHSSRRQLPRKPRHSPTAQERTGVPSTRCV